ncbi:uncharacterized protein VTP21DRAFT_4715 [Calcarisporiella thermophila]|uniref:uncharacterized protein n=1 Tax=Calcarisporiella thermophila TaxID=911321 RepID=UPI0037421EF2
MTQPSEAKELNEHHEKSPALPQIPQDTLSEKPSHTLKHSQCDTPDSPATSTFATDPGEITRHELEEKGALEDPEVGLPPTDTWRSWLVILGGFLVIFNNFGQTYCWGQYQDIYLTQEFKGEASTLAMSYIGTVATAFMFFIGPFLGPVLDLVGFRGSMVLGTILCTVSLLLASFNTALWQLYLTQGLLFGLGNALLFFPSVVLPTQWFKKYRGLATGISVSGSGIGGLCLNPLVRYLLATLGYRWSLRISAIISLVLLSAATLLCRPRIPHKKSSAKHKIIETRIITWRMGALFFFGVFASFGYLLPFFMLPAYSRTIGVDPNIAAILTGVMSGVNSLGRICIGSAADLFGRLNTMFWCTLISGVSTMVIWPFSKSLGLLVFYVIMYGLSAGGFVSLFPVAVADLVEDPADLSSAVGMVYFSCFFGNLVGTPLAGAILDSSGFIPLMEFAGGLTVLSSVFVLWLRLNTDRRIFVKI